MNKFVEIGPSSIKYYTESGVQKAEMKVYMYADYKVKAGEEVNINTNNTSLLGVSNNTERIGCASLSILNNIHSNNFSINKIVVKERHLLTLILI